jgi:hypothetical protein
MDEHEFDSLRNWRPFGAQDVQGAQRVNALAAQLWVSRDHLQRQLLAPYPEIPAGFDLADFRRLQRLAQLFVVSATTKGPQVSWLPSRLLTGEIIVGAQRFTLPEACCEVVNRAIKYLENR